MKVVHVRLRNAVAIRGAQLFDRINATNGFKLDLDVAKRCFRVTHEAFPSGDTVIPFENVLFWQTDAETDGEKLALKSKVATAA